MATEIWSAPLGEIRLAGASKGVALSTTAAFTVLPKGTNYIQLIPRNFSTAVVARYLLNPYLLVVRTTDSGATGTDYSDEAQDGDAATEVVLDAQGAAADGDFLYVGSHVPFRGVVVDVSGDAGEVNANASVLTVKYWKAAAGENPAAWATITATDGTASGGASIAQDGNVTWTVPTDWIPCSLKTVGDAANMPWMNDKDIYWTRWEWSLALDAATKIDAMLAMNRSTAYAELTSTDRLECSVTRGPGGIACVEALADAGTGNLLINVATRHGKRFA